MEPATSGARTSCSGERRRRNVGNWAAILPQLLLNQSTTICASKWGELKRFKNLMFFFQGHIPSSIWIGATDQAIEGNRTWTDCTPWNFTRWGLREGQQQPDNSRLVDGDGENCARLQGKNTTKQGWEDVACNLKEREFVCSRPVCSGENSFGSSF